MKNVMEIFYTIETQTAYQNIYTCQGTGSPRFTSYPLTHVFTLSLYIILESHTLLFELHTFLWKTKTKNGKIRAIQM